MGLFKIFLLIGIVTGLVYYFCPCQHVELKVIKSGWWGKGSRANYKEDASIRKFAINISDKVLENLKTQLKSTVYPEPLENSNFEYGFNSVYLKQVIDYWITKYNWKSQESILNAFSHHKTQIDGLDIHFIHVKPKTTGTKLKVIPIILVHGWPGSFVEYLDASKILAQQDSNRDFVFEVIIPSIPGYGFSEAPHQIGFSQMETAYVFDKLMQRLGFSSYYAHGGDWGSFVVRNMALQYPERVKGMHVTMTSAMDNWARFKWMVGAFCPSLVVDPEDQNKMYPIKDTIFRLLKETGYMHLQATKPDTIGLALANSPAGLAAYILEKFSTWTTPEGPNHADGLLTKKFTLDQLLTNVMVYYVTNSITSSQRYYKEWARNDYQRETETLQVLVPSGIAAFPNEILNMPESFVKSGFKQLVSYTRMERGGHFAAFEEPELMSKDICKFVYSVEKLPKESKV